MPSLGQGFLNALENGDKEIARDIFASVMDAKISAAVSSAANTFAETGTITPNEVSIPEMDSADDVEQSE